VSKERKTEEQYKEDIHNTYIRLRHESSRRDVLYSQFSTFLFKWCEEYYFSDEVFGDDNLVKEANLYGEEINKVINRFTKDNNNVPENKKEFFLYLYTSLNNAKKEYYLNNKDEVSFISVVQKKKLKEINDTIIMLESDLGRRLSESDKIEKVSKFLGTSKEIVKKYLKLNKIKKVLNFQVEDSDGNTLKSRIKNNFDFDINNILDKQKIQILFKAIETFLETRQNRSRPCFKALITLFCLKNIRNIEDLYSILDNEILEDVKINREIPNYYDIYLRKHPNPDPNIRITQATASNMIKTFKIFINENYPEIFQ